MSDGPPIQISASAATLPEALTAVLRQIVATVGSPPSIDALTGTIQAEATSASALLPQLTGSLTGLIDDFEAVPIDVSIDGLRWLDGAVRAWGSVTLSRERFHHPMDIDWLGAPSVVQMEDRWRIEGRVVARPVETRPDL
jgi:hypothetical protein